MAGRICEERERERERVNSCLAKHSAAGKKEEETYPSREAETSIDGWLGQNASDVTFAVWELSRRVQL